MKPKFASIQNSRPSPDPRDLPGQATHRRTVLLGLSLAAGLFLSGCAVDVGPGYAPYSGPYYGSYGPYSGEEFAFGGVRHGWHSGEHHLYGSSFGHSGFSGGGRGGSFHGGGAFHGGGGHGHYLPSIAVLPDTRSVASIRRDA